MHEVKPNPTIASIWHEDISKIFARGHCSGKGTVFRELSSRKTASLEEQIMSKDKCPSVIPRQMEAIVVIILQLFFATRAVLKIGEYSRTFPVWEYSVMWLMWLISPKISKYSWKGELQAVRDKTFSWQFEPKGLGKKENFPISVQLRCTLQCLLIRSTRLWNWVGVRNTRMLGYVTSKYALFD